MWLVNYSWPCCCCRCLHRCYRCLVLSPPLLLLLMLIPVSPNRQTTSRKQHHSQLCAFMALSASELSTSYSCTSGNLAKITSSSYCLRVCSYALVHASTAWVQNVCQQTAATATAHSGQQASRLCNTWVSLTAYCGCAGMSVYQRRPNSNLDLSYIKFLLRCRLALCRCRCSCPFSLCHIWWGCHTGLW